MKSLNKIMKIVEGHERRLMSLENFKKEKIVKILGNKKDAWYKSGSTIDKLLKLNSENFFAKPRNLTDIISKLKERDFHLKASDLTLPLRKVVRKGLLRKTKKFPDGSVSKNWHYLKE